MSKSSVGFIELHDVPRGDMERYERMMVSSASNCSGWAHPRGC